MSVGAGAAAAGPLEACAWLSWASGNLTHARVYTTRAASSDPGHTLAGILLQMVENGKLPDWAFTSAA